MTSGSELSRDVERELEWGPAIDERRIAVCVLDGVVTLRGTVRSWLERHEAEKAAWAAPRVTAVHNHITVESPTYAA